MPRRIAEQLRNMALKIPALTDNFTDPGTADQLEGIAVELAQKAQARLLQGQAAGRLPRGPVSMRRSSIAFF